MISILADLNGDAQQALQDGVASKNWILIVAGGLAVAIPIVLHALGKDVPVVSPILQGLLDLVKKSQPPAPPPPKGMADVVPIKDEEKKP